MESQETKKQQTDGQKWEYQEIGFIIALESITGGDLLEKQDLVDQIQRFSMIRVRKNAVSIATQLVAVENI